MFGIDQKYTIKHLTSKDMEPPTAVSGDWKVILSFFFLGTFSNPICFPLALVFTQNNSKNISSYRKFPTK